MKDSASTALALKCKWTWSTHEPYKPGFFRRLVMWACGQNPSNMYIVTDSPLLVAEANLDIVNKREWPAVCTLTYISDIDGLPVSEEVVVQAITESLCVHIAFVKPVEKINSHHEATLII